MQGSQNQYFIMRHGQAVTNIRHIVARKGAYPLTPLGRQQVSETARRLKNEGINMLVTSPTFRAQETARIVADHLNITDVHTDACFEEINFGIFEGGNVDDWITFFSSRAEKFIKPIPQGESFADLRQRIVEGIARLEKKYRNRVILIVSHDDPLWILYSSISRLTNEEALRACKSEKSDKKVFMDFAQAIVMPYYPSPDKPLNFKEGDGSPSLI